MCSTGNRQRGAVAMITRRLLSAPKVLLAVVLGGLVLMAQVGAQSPSEYQVKAAFLFNFTKFVAWPAAAFRSGDSPITVCLLGEDPFGNSLDQIVKGQVVGGRSLAVRRLAQIPRDEGCHMVFLSGLEKNRAAQAVAGIKNLPILTVSDGDEIGEIGSTIIFFVEDNKIRFNINLDAAERAGIKISSQLLKLAKNVHEGKKS